MNYLRTGLVFVIGIGLAGCQSHLNYSKSIELTPGEDSRFTVDAPKRDQVVIFQFSSSAVPISACMCLKSDENAVATSLVLGKIHEGVLARQENVKQGLMEAKIPAGREAMVFVWGATKNTTVKVHIKGK